ncbi:MAG: PEP-CTERM sorting domain-containing protein [Verrucomicrobiota bacterium]
MLGSSKVCISVVGLVFGLGGPQVTAAVLLSDDFSTGPFDSGKWDLPSLSESGSGSFEIGVDGTLGLVTPGEVGAVRPSARVDALTSVARSSDWTLTATMNLADLADLSSTFSGGDGVALTIQIKNSIQTGDRLELNLAAINFGSPGYAVRSADRLEGTGNINEPIIMLTGSTATTATLIVTYDSATQMTSSGYQVNGGPLQDFGFQSDLSGWATGVGDDFAFTIEASAGNFAGGAAPLAGTMDFSAGEVAFDSILIEDTYTELVFVPEPETAMLVGMGVLGVLRRRRR